MSVDNGSCGFFRVILEHHLKQEELKIPRNFVERYWKEISNPILITLPNGAEWKISWTRRNEDIWFDKNNWKRFNESLRYGYFLVFKYKGGSYFKVLIFDKSTLEIDYSTIRCVNEGEEPSIGYEKDGFEVIEESERPTQPFKKNKRRSNGDKDPCFETEGAPSQRTNLGKRKINVECPTQQRISGSKSRGGVFKAAIEERAGSARSNEIPSFTITMKATHVNNSALMIPGWFSKKYLNGFNGYAAIGVGDGSRTWLVRLRICNIHKQTIMGSGLKLFCRDNNLEVGDVCKFVMIEVDEPALSFQVTIKRGCRNEANQQNQEGSKEGPMQNTECGNFESAQFGKRKCTEGVSNRYQNTNVLENFGSSNKKNKFKVTIRASNLKGTTPVIPNEFMKRNGRCNKKYVALYDKEKLIGHVKMIYYPHRNHGSFSGGWNAFARKCKLKVGDICEFEMMNKEDLALHVSISRHMKK